MSKTHVIDGVTYIEVGRKAKVGDVVWLVNLESSLKISGANDLDLINADIIDGCIKLLKPLEEECCAYTPDIHDLLANLARRVASLEQQLRDTQGNVEKLAEELANAKHRVSKHATMFGVVEERVGMLDERSQVLNAINKFYEEGNR
jgi:hypothetical protein